MQDTILIVEDTAFFTKVLTNQLRKETEFRIASATCYAEAVRQLDRIGERIFLALLDLNLPDAPDGEVVTLMAERGVRSVVFTGTVDEPRRELLLQLPIVDYVVKQGQSSVDDLIRLIHHLRANSGYHALIVDDSSTARRHFGGMLRDLNFDVLSASSGEEGLSLYRQHLHNIRLILVDYAMAGMGGVEMIRAIRHDASVDDLAILGISGTGDPTLAANFLKNGASDYVAKNATREEVITRILINLDRLRHVAKLKYAATRDYLSGLFNRRYFFDSGEALCANARREKLDIAVAMLDIDHFKQVNDRYGHKVGDKVIINVANIMQQKLRESDLVARMGGEEFCILLMGAGGEQASDVLNGLREQIAASVVEDNGEAIQVTISIGLHVGLRDSLEQMIHLADEALYRAKNSGRNRLCS